MRRVRLPSRGWQPRSSLRPPMPSAAFTGATLSEVLISLMVMGIGVTSLALLIATSVLRSIQATQLTNATIHRMNVEQLIETFPRLVHSPMYTETQYGRFIVDPLGYMDPALNLAAADVHLAFGNNNGSIAYPRAINRYAGAFGTAPALQLNSIQMATRAAYLGDTWQLAGKGVPDATLNTSTSIKVGSGIDLDTFANSTTLQNFNNGVRVRIILFSPDGKQSAIRDHTPANPLTIDTTAGIRTITWGTATTWASHSRFRLEIYETRYSWLLTVRKTPNSLNPSGDANVDVVVFHKRTFSAASEQVFNLAPKTGINPNNLGLAAGDLQFTLDLTSTNAMAPPIKPFLKKGSFVFDAENGYWYRVVQIVDHAVNPVVTIDRPALAAITAGMANPNNGPDIMAMPGVVEVYPIGTISYDINNQP